MTCAQHRFHQIVQHVHQGMIHHGVGLADLSYLTWLVGKFYHWATYPNLIPITEHKVGGHFGRQHMRLVMLA